MESTSQPFKMRENLRMQPQKEAPAESEKTAPPASTTQTALDGISFPPPKAKRKAYNVYIKIALMDQIKDIATTQGISTSAALEACLERVFKQTGKND